MGKKDKQRDKNDASPDPGRTKNESFIRQEPSKEFGLSITTEDKGFKMMPEGFIMCNEIFTLLFERFD